MFLLAALGQVQQVKTQLGPPLSAVQIIQQQQQKVPQTVTVQQFQQIVKQHQQAAAAQGQQAPTIQQVFCVAVTMSALFVLWISSCFNSGIHMYLYFGERHLLAYPRRFNPGMAYRFTVSVKVRTDKISAIGYRLWPNIGSKYRLHFGDFPPIYR